MAAEHEKGRCGKMTFKQMGCTPEETERRIAVCNRLNVLAHKKAQTADQAKAKRIDRAFDCTVPDEVYEAMERELKNE